MGLPAHKKSIILNFHNSAKLSSNQIFEEKNDKINLKTLSHDMFLKNSSNCVVFSLQENTQGAPLVHSQKAVAVVKTFV